MAIKGNGNREIVIKLCKFRRNKIYLIAAHQTSDANIAEMGLELKRPPLPYYRFCGFAGWEKESKIEGDKDDAHF